LNESNLTGAILTGCNIYGISAWDLEREAAEQSNLVITHLGDYFIERKLYPNVDFYSGIIYLTIGIPVIVFISKVSFENALIQQGANSVYDITY
jgi:uncharacterized protein YjbI with pentapeptide repeats